MATFGVETKIVMSTDKVRTNLTSFYKALITENPKFLPKQTINASESITIDLSESTVFVLICDKFGLEKDALDVIFTNSSLTTQNLLIENTGFIMFNCSNMVSAKITNNLTDYPVDVFLVY